MDYKKKLPQYLFARGEDRPSSPTRPFIILPKFLTIFHPPQHCVWGKEPDRAGGAKHTCVLGPLQLTPPASKAYLIFSLDSF